MPGRNYQSSLNFPYGYQGQEKDAETGLTNFELRQYDGRIGRWYNPDPMGQHHSPYLAMGNNPVSSVDPDGGWDGGYGGGYGGDDAFRDNLLMRNGTQNNFINGDVDQGLHAKEDMALSMHTYNDYRAHHTNEDGQWGNWMHGQSARDLDDVTDTHFDIDESARIQNPAEAWTPLPKWLLKAWVQTDYCPTCGNGKLEDMTGKIFENTFHKWAKENHTSSTYIPNQTKFIDVVPDGISASVGYDPQSNKIIMGINWWEVKATKNQITLSSFQIKKEINSLNLQKFDQKTYNLVTTSDVNIDDRNSVLIHATSKKIYFSHLKAEYRITGDGKIMIRFAKSYSNFTLLQYKDEGVEIQAPTLKP